MNSLLEVKMLLKEARIFILRSSCPRMFEQLHNERKKKICLLNKN